MSIVTLCHTCSRCEGSGLEPGYYGDPTSASCWGCDGMGMVRIKENPPHEKPIRTLLAALADYQAGPPPWMEPANVAADVEVAAGVTCEGCGREGLAYFGVHRRNPPSYKAFASCPACAWSTEF